MKSNKMNLVQTGVTLVDNNWGGFYRGGTYLLIGPRKSGRTLLGLQFAMEGLKNKETCLYFTTMRSKDLMILAASIDFDLQTYMNQNEMIVVKISPPEDIYEGGTPDNLLAEYFDDFASVVEEYQPQRLIFDELTSFVGFESVNILKQTFLKTIEKIEEKNITSLYLISEPATPFAQNIVDSVAQHSTAIIYLQKVINGTNSQGGRATITPNIGHTEGQFASDYLIEPYKGVTFQSVPGVSPYRQSRESQQAISDSSRQAKPVENQAQQNNYVGITQMPSKYRPLSDVDVAPQPFSFSNQYDIEEFKLILNNQIALFKSTGQSFSLVALKLDPIAEQQKVLTINQLQNAVRLSSDKKDKICIHNSTILLLLNQSDDKTLNILVAKIRGNLPVTDPNSLRVIMGYIFAYSYRVNDSVVNADSILNEVIG